MFNFLRNLTKSADEKHRERINAYLDNELSPREREQFEQELRHDASLRAELEDLRAIKLNVQQLPRVRAPRNYTLDPAVYGQPAAGATWQLYPALRVATALTAFFFIIAVVMDLMTPAGLVTQPIAGYSAPYGETMAASDDSRAAGGETKEEGVQAEPEMAAEPLVQDREAIETEGEADTAPDAYPYGESAGENDATDAEEAVAEEEAAEEPEAPAAQAPAQTPTVAGTPEADVANAAETAATAVEVTRTTAITGDLEAVSPREGAGNGAGAEEGARALSATAATEPAVAAAPTTEISSEDLRPPQRPSFPWLMAVEIALGVAFAVLLAVTLLIRRNL